MTFLARFGTVLTGIFLLSGCERVYSSVTSFHDEQGLIPGKTFVIVPLKGQENNLEFKEYAGLITSELQRHGYFPVTNGTTVYYGVRFVYGLKRVHNVASTMPVYIPNSNDFGSAYLTMLEARRIEREMTPFYQRYLTLIIFNNQTGQTVYEGRLKSAGRSGSFANVARCFIFALFKKFPGENGEVEKINMPTSKCEGYTQGDDRLFQQQ